MMISEGISSVLFGGTFWICIIWLATGTSTFLVSGGGGGRGTGSAVEVVAVIIGAGKHLGRGGTVEVTVLGADSLCTWGGIAASVNTGMGLIIGAALLGVSTIIGSTLVSISASIIDIFRMSATEAFSDNGKVGRRLAIAGVSLGRHSLTVALDTVGG